MSYSIDSTKADILVTGSSRATHHYDSDLISDLTGHSFYNAGSEGHGIVYSAAVVSSALDRYKPKLIIIDLRPDEFINIEDEDLAVLLPYHKNKAVLPYINIYSDFENIKLQSKIYPYNSLLTTIIAGRSNRVDKNTFDRHGFVPMEGVLKDTVINDYNDKNYKIDQKKIVAFKKLISRLEKEKIRCLLVISPLYFHYHNGNTVSIVKKMTSKLEYIKFFSFGNQNDFFDPAKFDDEMHLNNSGASTFSKRIAHLIKAQL